MNTPEPISKETQALAAVSVNAAADLVQTRQALETTKAQLEKVLNLVQRIKDNGNLVDFATEQQIVDILAQRT